MAQGAMVRMGEGEEWARWRGGQARRAPEVVFWSTGCEEQRPRIGRIGLISEVRREW